MEVKPGEAFTAEQAAVKQGYLDCRNRKIKSITGIEFFPKIEVLLLEDNSLTQVDLSRNPSLLELTLSTNQLTGLDCSHNPHIRRLECQNNRLKTLVLPDSDALVQLLCSFNQLESLDVSHFPGLELLCCAANRLSALDLSQNKALYTLDCSRNQLTTLDLTNCRYLNYLHCQFNRIKELNLSQNPVLMRLKCFGNPLSDFHISLNTGRLRNLRGDLIGDPWFFPYNVPPNSELSWPESASLPDWILHADTNNELSTTYALSSEMNPFYLRGDFNGDGQLDLAVYIIKKETGITGIAIFHKNKEEYFILGAGHKIGRVGDFNWMDAWQIYDKGKVEPGMEEGPPPTLLGNAIYVEKTEAFSAIIYWDGKAYQWYHQGD